MGLTDFFVGLGLREHAFQFVVEAGVAGVLGPGGEFLSGDAEFLADGLAVAALEVGLVFEILGEVEMGFGIVDPVVVVGIACGGGGWR